MKYPSVSLVITTYNRPKALFVVLQSAIDQTYLPNEIIVADDGSTQETADVVSQVASMSPVPIIHSWQSDNGFRLSASRNKAIAKSSSDYIILIDGDMFLHRCCVEDHLRAARPLTVYISSRVLLSAQATTRIEDSQNRCLLAGDIEKSRANGWRIVGLFRLLPKITDYNATKGYLGFWRTDCVKVNGFDETFQGWGREDNDFVMRMIHSGVTARKLKFAAISYHMHHKVASSDSVDHNTKMLLDTIKCKRIKAIKGIDQYLSSTL